MECFPDVPGLLGMGTDAATIVKAPFCIPDPPIPATARPTINILEDVAIAQIRDPTSNMKKNVRNDHCY